jgi:hypothetical protein
MSQNNYIIDKELNLSTTYNIENTDPELEIPKMQHFDNYHNELATISTLRFGLSYLYKIAKTIESRKLDKLKEDQEKGIGYSSFFGADLHLHSEDQMFWKMHFTGLAIQ